MLTELRISMLEVFESFWGIEFLFPFNLLNITRINYVGPKSFQYYLIFDWIYAWFPQFRKTKLQRSQGSYIFDEYIMLVWSEIFWWNSRYITLSKYFIAFHSYIHRCHFFNEFLNYLEWMINLHVIILAYLWNSQIKKYYSVVWF